MSNPKAAAAVVQLFSIRNQYGPDVLKNKLQLLNSLSPKAIKGTENFKLYYEALLFLSAYPDNATIAKLAADGLEDLNLYIQQHDGVEYSLYNSSLTGTRICATFSFEMVKWLKANHPDDISVVSVEAEDGTIQSILCAVQPKVESEIMQDANENWMTWLKTNKRRPDLLDKLLPLFEQADIRPEVKDELWNTLGIDVEVSMPVQCRLPDSLIKPYYHRSIIKSGKTGESISAARPAKVKLSESEAEQVIECSKMILIRHLREMDPITFTAPSLVSYYHLPRGLSVALLAMTPDRRHPIDSYMSYVAFKNGLPMAYGGAWLLFDSSRTALNVFPAYRGGESQHIFEEVLRLKKFVYKVKRFTADPYQIGKENKDGIKSASFWLYHRVGFRPVNEKQQQIAEEEYTKIKNDKGYRTPAKVLEELANSRIEWVMQGSATWLDATDISRAYRNIIQKRYSGNRKLAEEKTLDKLTSILKIKHAGNERLSYVLKNWCVLLLEKERELLGNRALQTTLRNAFLLKADGAEEEYDTELQGSKEFRKLVEEIVAGNLT